MGPAEVRQYCDADVPRVDAAGKALLRAAMQVPRLRGLAHERAGVRPIVFNRPAS